MSELMNFIAFVFAVASLVGAFSVAVRFLALYRDPYPALVGGLVLFAVYNAVVCARLPK